MSRPHLTEGELVLHLCSCLESKGVAVTYLRNYESLPQSVGNDVDLLVPKNLRRCAIEIIKESLRDSGWMVSRVIEFGPFSVFLSTTDGSRFIHMDLFDRIEWHWLEYANSEKIFQHRKHNGQVYQPAAEDEIVLNLMTRLLYAGRIRDKHREQASCFIETSGRELLEQALTAHLGPQATRLVLPPLARQDWQSLESLAPQIHKCVFAYQIRNHPLASAKGLCRYLKRACSRIIRPPGPFLVFEGADGVGKSTIIEGILPLLKQATGRSNALLFHWKPTRRSIRLPGEPAGAPQQPRQKKPRPMVASLAFLAYHWLGFWLGYLRHVLPARAANRAVVGDRYAYEFLLDPDRLRLRLPAWLLRLAARSVPQPSLVIGLTATPERIVSRKAELSSEEISQYQQRLAHLAGTRNTFVMIDADPGVESVRTAVCSTLVNRIFLPTNPSQHPQ